MKWGVILLVVIGIIVVGGAAWIMAKSKENSLLQRIKDLRDGKPVPFQAFGKNRIIQKNDSSAPHKEGSSKGDRKKTDNGNLTPKSSEMWEGKAQAILRQNPTKLKEYGFPLVRDILTVEAEKERIRLTYDTMREITQLYLERMGIKDVLQSIAEMAVYIPQGLREYDETKQILPLHASVWNTSANTLKRQTAKLFLKSEKLMQLEEETELVDIDAKTEQVLKNVRAAWNDYKAANASEDSARKLQRAVEAYPARKNAAEESLQTYSMALSEEKKANVLALCSDLKKLMDSDSFCRLEKYEVHDGEKVSVDMDGEEFALDPMTNAYWEKVKLLAAEIQDFIHKWNEKFES